MTVRTERLSNVLLKEINDIIYNVLRDKDIQNTTATFVKLEDDYKKAYIYCTNYNLDVLDKAIKDLNNAENFIRTELFKKKIKMRVIPRLEFLRDTALEYGINIEKIIKEKINN